MGKPTGFLEYKRLEAGCRPIAERIRDYREVRLPILQERLMLESARCMDCGIPFCHSLGCPLGNLIPEWNDSVYKGQWREAWKRLELTNNFPEITGRVCPAPCEASCTLAINRSSVAIKEIELAIIEEAFSKGWVEPEPPRFESGRRVAVVGSGPAGLAASQQLRKKGHQVSLFERSAKIGGLLRYGIPNFKLDKTILDRRLNQIAAEGVEFETNVVIGEDLSARYLKHRFDVVLLTIGAGKPRDLDVPGRGYDGIHFAMDFLTKANQSASGEISEEKLLSAKGRRVLVIGGGDTGADCVGTAIRQQALEVRQVEILPRPLEWSKPYNPHWPYWPNILRTSTSHQEGCRREWAVSVTQFTGGYDARVQKAHLVRLDWQRPENGAPAVMAEITGSDFSIDVDLVLLAMGFVHVEHSRLLEDLGVSLDQRGNILTDNNCQTTADGIFAAGDAQTGASLVVGSINQGRLAAQAIDRYLK